MAEEGRVKQTLRVGNFSCQSREQRYPDPYRKYAQSNQANIVHYVPSRLESPEEPDEPPRIAQWRLNLVALSQDLNLYFAAYRDSIHCYIPRDLRQTLRAKADLILQLPRSDRAREIGGHILPALPHCINHMIVGDLGELEILLVATDDGDVIAYYTHLLWDEIDSSLKGARATIGVTCPFFHTNVKASAWGLAIHQKSRLIAVSSNRREATIFAFGYAGHESCGFVPDVKHSCRKHRHEVDTFPVAGHISPPITSLKNRKCNFRICIQLKWESNNIPSIAFISGSDGEAMELLAGDINGNLWILKFFGSDHTRLPSVLHSNLSNRRVWGVLSIPLDNFRLAKTPHDAYGISKISRSMSSMENLLGNKPQDGQFFDISSCVDSVESVSASSCAPELTLDEGQDLVADSLNSNPIDSLHENIPISTGAFTPQQLALNYISTSASRDPLARVRATESVRYTNINIENDPFFQANKVIPTQDATASVSRTQRTESETFRRLLCLPFSTRSLISDWNQIDCLYLNCNIMKKGGFHSSSPNDEMRRAWDIKLNTRIAYLRCYAHDIEMLSPMNLMTFRTILRRPIHSESSFLAPILPVERLSLQALIPELNLVVVGSQNGRVCLLTLTKMEEPGSPMSPLVMFRLDLILPLRQHNFHIRPTCPLLGMAVSPLPRDETNASFASVGKRRWRIILHYCDHTILSYDIFREEEGDVLKVA